jgi:beta-galactosidase
MILSGSKRKKTMRKRYILIIGILVTICFVGCRKPIPPVNFNKGWQFVKSDLELEKVGIDKVKWEPVSLPHTATIEPKVMDGQWQGICWYYKKFDLPENSKGKEFYLRFEGAMNICDVWVNGVKLIRKQGGYLPVVVNFTTVARSNQPNEVLVRLDNFDNPLTGPKPMRSLDFNMYGGLYRDAYLIVKSKLHITDANYAGIKAGGGVFVTYPKISKEEATVEVKTDVANDYDQSKKVTLVNEIWDGNSKVATAKSSSLIIEGKQSSTITAQINLPDPKLWSPKTPSLYQLKTKIVSNGIVIDEIENSVGIRRFEIKKEGFFINGERMFLRGVNRHQDYPYIGYALSNEAQYRDAVKIKEAGFDYIRLSHYPHSPAFLDACDQLGIVVLDAILGWQYYTRDSAFQQQIFQTGRELIRRDRNHPCVIAWELSLNESWMDEPFIDELQKITHEEYPGDQCYSAGWQEYGYDIYLQARQHRLGHYVESSKPYIVSEYGDWEYFAMNAGFNQELWKDLKEANRSSRQLISEGEVRLLQQATNIQEAHNDNYTTTAFADGYWVMFDYNRGCANDLESSGIMSIDRLPKYSYYFFQSQRDASEKSELYKSGSMVFIASCWNELSPLNVRVFSNCDEVELSLNGKSIGRQNPDKDAISKNLSHPPFTFKLKAFEKGELVAKGYIGGKEVATYSVKTPGTPVTIDVTIDESHCAPKAGCNDVVFVYARLTDANGTVVPLNNIKIDFNIEGDAELINKGSIFTEAGIATGLLRIGNSTNTIKIIASDSLKQKGSVEFKPF